MRSCTCGSDSGPSTMNSRRDEDSEDEEALDSWNTQVRVIRCALYFRVQLRGYASVELADASPFRLAADQLLASGRYLDPQQDPLRQFSRSARASLVLEGPHVGTLGTGDSRAA